MSEQELVDCVKGLNHGCNGGFTIPAFEYIAMHGITSESGYPYRAREGSCKGRSVTPVARVSGFKKVPSEEQSLLDHVFEQPVSVVVKGGSWLSLYRGGVANPKCEANIVGFQDMLIVGFTATDAGNYWIIKSSWGTSWGDKGYLLLARGSKCITAENRVVPVH